MVCESPPLGETDSLPVEGSGSRRGADLSGTAYIATCFTRTRFFSILSTTVLVRSFLRRNGPIYGKPRHAKFAREERY